jgi:hypothetical protein
MAKRISSDAHFRSLAHNPAKRGYCIVYREDVVNYCPGCGRTHWFVGRVSTECGFCATALPFATSAFSGDRSFLWL